MPATPEPGGSHLGEGGRRLALVVATGTYADPALAQLRAPGRDATDLAAVLADAAIGGYEVETLLDEPAEALRRRIASFCASHAPGDLTLVYLSCHGVLDDRGRLYYAATDTDRSLLAATALPAAWLNEQLEDCRGRRQILVLDCCHSGAFARGAKGEDDLALAERFEGRGRVVLTGSRGTEYSFEHDEVVGEASSSVFTGAIVAGLRSGDADRDGDGVVSVSELYDYAFDTVRVSESRQTPTLWTYGAEGDLAVARSPRGKIVAPAPLPEDVAMLLESSRPRVRESGVQELAELLDGADEGRALTARAELERVAAEDVTAVAAAARAALGGAQAAPGPPPSEPPRPAGPPPPFDPPPPSEPASPPPRRPRTPASRQRLWAGLAGAALIAAAVILVVALSGSSEDSADPVGAIPAAAEEGVIEVPGSPRGVAVEGSVTWVSRYDDGIVTRIDSATRKATSIEVGHHPGKIAAGEGSVWVSIEDGKRLVRLDPDTGQPAGATIDLEADNCNGCAATELVIAEHKLWVGSDERRAITTYDLASGESVADPYRPGEGFEGVFVVGDRGTIWALANNDLDPSHSFMVRIGPQRPESPERVDLGTGSFLSAIAFGDESVFVADAANGRNLISQYFDEEKELTEIAEIESGVSSDDLAYAEGRVIVWDPAGGVLSRVVPAPYNRKNEEDIPDFRVHQEVNEEASDMAVGGRFAWLTEPFGDKLYKVAY